MTIYWNPDDDKIPPTLNCPQGCPGFMPAEPDKQDAARYRWLRRELVQDEDPYVYRCEFAADNETLDAYCDEGLAQEPARDLDAIVDTVRRS